MEDLDKKYYRIGDVAEFIGVPESTIRYWEQEFTEVSPKRVSRNVRLYTPDDIQTLRIIHYLLKVRGLRIEAAKTQMQMNRKNISRRLKVLDELTEVRDELTVMLKTLGKRKD
ncbi:MAG: MerR family transcriptional regulator [Bacteroidales bacterium]|nr:MerR family transcriptional regulator [Bacteroidales bacterium]